jgi:hypothetical protein
MNFNNGVAFILTNLAFQAVIGHFGVYAIMKYPMASLFGYDEYYLGIALITQEFSMPFRSLG